MAKDFSLYELGDKVTLMSKVGKEILFGLVSFIDLELQTMSITVGKGCNRSEDTIVVLRFWDTSTEVLLGWSDPKLAEKQLTPRPCPWYSDKKTSEK